jgi:hypothetical protein
MYLCDMRILIKENQYGLLLEQLNISLKYNDIVDASSGPGTDPDKILNVLNDIKDVKEFKTLLSMFKDKKTGYESFEEMVNQEYDRFNYDDIVKLKDRLYSLGVIVSFRKAENNFGQNLFAGNFKIQSYLTRTSKTSEISKKNNILHDKELYERYINTYEPLLSQAKKYWIDWLSNPITKEKFIKNWSDRNYSSDDVNNIFKNYLNSLNKLKLFFYDKSTKTINNVDIDDREKGAYAFVDKESPNNVYINCFLSKKDDDKLGTMIHEIQHLIYFIHPLNPDVKVGELFVNKNTKKIEPFDFFNNFSTVYNNNHKMNYSLSQNIINTSKIYNVDSKILQNLLVVATKNEKNGPGYSCNENEKMSNISAIRKLFNINPGQDITVKMLTPYIKGQKKDLNVSWLLICWALKDFPDISELVNKINQLAYQDFQKQNNTKLV